MNCSMTVLLNCSMTVILNFCLTFNVFWCGFDRASSIICGNKMPTRCNSPQTGHTTLSSTPYRQLENQAPNTTGSNHLHNTLELLMMGIMVPETCWASNKICIKIHLLHLVGILFPHISLTFCWPCIIQWFLVIVQLDAQISFNVFIYLQFSICFEHVMLIIRRNKLFQYSYW